MSQARSLIVVSPFLVVCLSPVVSRLLILLLIFSSSLITFFFFGMLSTLLVGLGHGHTGYQV